MLKGNDRALAIYKAIAALNPNLNKLSGNANADGTPNGATYVDANKATQPSEKYALLQALQTLWGADTVYLTGAAQIQANTLEVPAGIPVATTGSPAAQTGKTVAPQMLDSNGYGLLS